MQPTEHLATWAMRIQAVYEEATAHSIAPVDHIAMFYFQRWLHYSALAWEF